MKKTRKVQIEDTEVYYECDICKKEIPYQDNKTLGFGSGQRINELLFSCHTKCIKRLITRNL